MKQHSPSIPELNGQENCITPADLFVSEKFVKFLALYNREWGTRIEVPDIINDYELAMDVYRFAEKCRVPGRTTFGIIANIHSLAQEVLAEIKERDSERVLSEFELSERFEDLGIDLDRIRMLVQAANNLAGYGKALQKSGVLKPDQDYLLPFPEITEEQMKTLEIAIKNMQVDEMYIDDARLTEEETFALHAPRTKAGKDQKIHNRIADSVPFTEADFAKVNKQLDPENMDDKVVRDLFKNVRGAKKQVDQKVRLLAFDSGMGMDNHESMGQFSGSCLREGLDPADGRQPISLGTYLRMTRFYNNANPILAQKLKTIFLTQDGKTHEEFDGETLLNNIDSEGRAILLSNDSYSRNRFKIKWVNPAEREHLRSTKRGYYY